MKLDKTRGSLGNKEEDLSRRRQSRNIFSSPSLSSCSFRCQPSLVAFIKATRPGQILNVMTRKYIIEDITREENNS